MAGFLRKVIEKSKTEVTTLPAVAYYCSTSALPTFSSQSLCFTAKIRRTLEIESRVRRMQVIIFVLVLAAWKSYLEY